VSYLTHDKKLVRSSEGRVGAGHPSAGGLEERHHVNAAIASYISVTPAPVSGYEICD
jgi:hypothetical protein